MLRLPPPGRRRGVPDRSGAPRHPSRADPPLNQGPFPHWIRPQPTRQATSGHPEGRPRPGRRPRSHQGRGVTSGSVPEGGVRFSCGEFGMVTPFHRHEPRSTCVERTFDLGYRTLVVFPIWCTGCGEPSRHQGIHPHRCRRQSKSNAQLDLRPIRTHSKLDSADAHRPCWMIRS